MNLAQNLHDTAMNHGGRPALRLDGHTQSYAELSDAAARVASCRRNGASSPATVSGWCCPTCRPSPSSSMERCTRALLSYR